MGLTNKLSAIGDAIRSKTGKSALLTLDEMPTEIRNIGANDSYGFKDISFSNLCFDNNANKIISGSAYDGNKIILTTSEGYTRALFVLNKPISIVPNDVIKLKLTKTSGTTSFSDCYMAVTPTSGRMAFKVNFNLPSNTTLTYTETTNSYDIIGFEIGSRLNTWNDAHLTVNLYLNDVQLF